MADKNENTKPSRVLKERWNLKEYGGTKDAYLDGSKIWNSHTDITLPVNNPKLEIDNIKLELLEKNIDKKEFDEIFDHEQKIIPEKFKSKCKKYKINYYKINRIMKNHLQELLNNKELISIMEEEQILNIILDNARIHTAKIVEESCEILSVNLVFLPPYCPFLNPIEGVWKDIKREIYNENYYSLNELIELFETKFYEKVDNTSYYDNWVMQFFGVNIS